jgi:Zn-dependent peptidase ImmA (M78 family)
LRRGFKTQAERSATAARQILGVSALSRLDPWLYASHLKVAILDFKRLGLTERAVRQLTVVDGDSWSAMTLEEAGVRAIVLNPAHASTRQANDLMHELAHVELKHTPARVEISTSGIFLLSDYSDDQEQEADWYAGAMLLPRDALIHHRSRALSVGEIAKIYGVSAPLCEWRLRMTGVDTQLKRRSG